MEALLSGKVTATQLEQWKALYGKVWEVVVEDKVAYFKKASRATMRAALSFLEKDRIKYMEIIIENCWIGGDEAMKSEDEYFYGLMGVVPELAEAKNAEIKKH